MALVKFTQQKVSLTACLFLLLTFHNYGQDGLHFTPGEEKVYQALWAIDEKGLEAALSTSTASTLYIANLYATLDLVLSDDASKFDGYEDMLEERLQELRTSQIKEPARSFFKAELMLQSAFVHLKFGHELEASWLLRQAYKETVRSAERFPQFPPHLKTLGLLHVLIGSVPSKYEWLLSLLGMQGSIESGLAELQHYARSGDPMAKEAHLLLELIHSYLLNDRNTMQQAQAHTVSPLEQFVQLLVSLKQGNGPSALAAFLELDRTGFPYPFLYYLGGEAHLRKGNYHEAIQQYQRFIRDSQGISNRKDAYYKTWLAFHLLGDPVETEKYFKLALSHGDTRSEADKYANRVLKNGVAPNALIMKIRLLTDGGYYRQADSVLQAHKHTKFKTVSESVEFTYRKARLAHKQGKMEQAIISYQKVIEKAPGKGDYFAPNACLQLGLVYIQRNRIEEAKYYLKKVKTYSRHAYKQSLDHKAKTALSRIEKDGGD